MAKKNGKRLAVKICACLVGVAIIIAVAAVILNKNSVKNSLEVAQSFEPVVFEDKLVPQKDENGYFTFTTDRDFKVVQFSDVHIGAGWMSTKKDAMALNAVAAMVTAEKPDLVVVTGDIAYPVPFQAGTANNLSGAKIFATLMEKLGVYWAISFGNHDTESYSLYDREAISDFYENSGFKYCLFQSGPEDIDGYGNYVINVKNTQGQLTQSIFMFDSHSYVDSDPFGIFWKYDNIQQSQVDWYANTLETLKAQNNGKHFYSTAFFHIPLTEHNTAWFEYADNGLADTANVKYVYGDTGESDKVVYSGIGEDELFETMLEYGSTKAVFVGHDHKNNFSLEYKGIRLSYAMSVDYLAYVGISKLGSQRGCTVIEYTPDGSFESRNENYYQDKYVSFYEKEQVTMQEVVYQP